MMKNLLDLRKNISRRLKRTLEELAQNLGRPDPVPVPVRVPIPVRSPIRGNRFQTRRSLHTFPNYSARYHQMPRIYKFLTFCTRVKAAFPEFSLKSQRFQSFYRNKLFASNKYFNLSSKNYLIYSLQHPTGLARGRRFGVVAQDLLGEKQFGVLEQLVLNDSSNAYNTLTSAFEPVGCYLEVSLNTAVGLSIPQSGFLNAHALSEIIHNLRYVIRKLELLIRDFEAIHELGELPIKYDAAAHKIYIFFWNRTMSELEDLIEDKNLNNFVTIAPLNADMAAEMDSADSVSSSDLLSSLSQSFDEDSDMFSSSDDSESFKLDPLSVTEPPLH